MTNVSDASWRWRSRDVARLEADADEDLVRSSVNGVGPPSTEIANASSPGGAVALVEGVDPFLDPHAGRIRAVAVLDVALGDRVRRGVDVERERGDAVLARVHEGVDARVLVGHPVVGGRPRVRRRRGRRGGG